MKIYLIRNEFDNGEGEIENDIKAYATKELAKQAIKTIIDDEINKLIDIGILTRKSDGNIEFDGHIEITDTHLNLSDEWGWNIQIWIEELDVITA